jgi:hypothetical protein
VVVAGTAMVAVMSTLAAATLTMTAEASTPATAAIELWREVVFVSSKSLTLPLTTIVSTTGGGGGGAAGVPGGGGGALAGASGGGGSDGQAQQLPPMGRRPLPSGQMSIAQTLEAHGCKGAGGDDGGGGNGGRGGGDSVGEVAVVVAVVVLVFNSGALACIHPK